MNTNVYALFIYYPNMTGYYNGIYPSLEETFDAIHETMEDMGISMEESPDILKAAKEVKDNEDFDHVFSNGTRIIITKVPNKLVESILRKLTTK